MKDLNLSLLLNVVAASGLLSSATGCSDDGVTPLEEPEVSDESIARSVCESLQRCDLRGEFETDHGSVEGCAEYWEEKMQYYEDSSGPVCIEAYRAYLKCATDNYDGCDYSDVAEYCDEQYADFEAECEP